MEDNLAQSAQPSSKEDGPSAANENLQRIMQHEAQGRRYLESNDFTGALEELKQAESLVKSYEEKEVVYNAMSQIYSKQGRYRIAQQYLLKLVQYKQTAESRLNLCAVYSKQGKHQQALEQALHASVLLHMKEINSDPDLQIKLILTQRNIAVELEHLERLQEALQYYRMVCENAEKWLNSGHPVRIECVKFYSDCLKQLNKGKQSPARYSSRSPTHFPRSSKIKLPTPYLTFNKQSTSPTFRAPFKQSPVLKLPLINNKISRAHIRSESVTTTSRNKNSKTSPNSKKPNKSVVQQTQVI